MGLVITKGEQREIDVRFVDERRKAIDITGGSAELVIATQADPDTPVLTKTSTTYINRSNDQTTDIDTKGYITFTLTDDEIDGLTDGEYVYDVKITDPDDVPTISQTYDLTIKKRRR